MIDRQETRLNSLKNQWSGTLAMVSSEVNGSVAHCKVANVKNQPPNIKQLVPSGVATPGPIRAQTLVNF